MYYYKVTIELILFYYEISLVQLLYVLLNMKTIINKYFSSFVHFVILTHLSNSNNKDNKKPQIMKL